MTTRPLSLRDLEEVHRVSHSHLAKWQKEGVDVYDSRSIARKIWSLRRRPPEWIEVYDSLMKSADDDSHEGLKRQKTKEEVEKLKIQNAKAKGDSFDRQDGEAVMASWIAALKLAHTEMIAMCPPQLVGLTESQIETFLSDSFRDMMTNLSDLQSQLWQEVYEHYITECEEPPANDAGSESDQAATEA